MALNLNPELISSAGTTTGIFESRVYLFQGSNVNTLNLPTVVDDGIVYTISKQDTDSNLIVNPTGGSKIKLTDNVADDVTTYNLPPRYVMELISYQQNWLLGQVCLNTSLGVKSIVCGTCTSNSTNPWIVVSGNANTLVTRITMNSNIPPSIFTCVINNVSAGPTMTGEIVMTTDAALTNKIISIPVSSVASGFSIVSGSILLNSVSTGTTYYVGWLAGTGTASNKIGICSIRLA